MVDWLSGIWSATHLTGRTLAWGALGFVLSSVCGLALAAVFVVRMPATYFSAPEMLRRERRPGLQAWAERVAMNLAGALVIVVGVLLSLPGVPGPGFLVILIGLMLMDVPAKYRLERWLVTRPGVLATINTLRSRYGKPPMVVGAAPGER